MSDTKRHVQPGWNQDHPNWSFGEMTEKYQCKDKSDGKSKSSKNNRFSKGMKNTRYNLQLKIEELSLEEELDLV